MELVTIRNMIYEVRGRKVMLDFELSEMYQVETRRLNESAKRNIRRFPPDFMFQLTREEWNSLMSQIATSSWGGTRKLPYAFTEQGVAMLAGLLNSDVAIEVNITIMRAFVAMRSVLAEYASTSREIAELWKKVKMLELQDEENLKAMNDLNEDAQKSFDDIYLALAQLAGKKKLEEKKPWKPVGFPIPNKKEI